MRRGGHNRLGFALQLCAFRYPGRILVAGETIPRNVLRFIAAQLGMRTDSGLSVRFCPLPESTPSMGPPPFGSGNLRPAAFRRSTNRHFNGATAFR